MNAVAAAALTLPAAERSSPTGGRVQHRPQRGPEHGIDDNAQDGGDNRPDESGPGPVLLGDGAATAEGEHQQVDKPD